MANSLRVYSPKTSLLLLLLVLVIFIMGNLSKHFAELTLDNPLLTDSTLGELGIWMAEQSGEEEIESFLGTVAQNWAQARGEESLEPETALATMRTILLTWAGFGAAITGLGALFVFVKQAWARSILVAALLILDGLLFIIPVTEGDNSLGILLGTIFILLVALLLAEGKITKVLGFFVALSSLFIVWEAAKFAAASQNYRITLPQAAWEYQAYGSLDSALSALEIGDADALIFDRRDLTDMIPPYPEVAGDYTYPNLRLLTRIDSSATVAMFNVTPELQGRLSVVVRQEDAANITSLNQINNVATVAGSFAETNYLALPRQLLLVDLKILNDLNLPHLQTIAEALLQPARRNGSQLLIRILGEAGLYTWGEAFGGFFFGALLGFFLGTIFAHSKLLERSLLPFVVASQTVPILAIAPMVVIWLGASQFSVAVIAAYLTFFPVAINTLRGLLSPKPTAIELMESYAASAWEILWKLRVPAALPYIFTALKVSATASVVGAIIGELPSGIGEGLGRAILDFSSDYSLVSTPKLWGAIVVAASVGILFFIMVTVLERLILGRYIRAS